MKRKKLFLIGGALVLVLIAGIAATRGEKGPLIQVGAVARETIQARVSANGKIQAVKKVNISANLMGQVTRLAVKEGDLVKAGQFLLEIDPERSKAFVQGLEAAVLGARQDLASANSRLEQARSDFSRAEANHKAGILSPAEHEQARTQLQTAQASAEALQRRVEQSGANLREAKVTLSKTTITAPIDGVVTARNIELGETAVIGVQNQPGTVLLTISDMSKVEAELEVDEASIPNVRLGQTAQVRIDAYPNQVFESLVTEVGGSPILRLNLNEAIKFKVKVQLKNPPSTIKPGLSAQAEIATGSRENAVALPIQALVMRPIKLKEGEKPKPGAPKEEEGVFLLDKGKAKFIPVKTGLLGEMNLEITEGLKGGEEVITGPFRSLRDLKDGQAVRVDKKKKDDAKGEEKK